MKRLRPTWVEVDLDAIRHNVRMLKPDGAELMAVVKADAYGHGDVAVARAALEAGAAWIGVALVEEGLRLRDAGDRRADPGACRSSRPGPRPRRSKPGSRPACTRTERSDAWHRRPPAATSACT